LVEARIFGFELSSASQCQPCSLAATIANISATSALQDTKRQKGGLESALEVVQSAALGTVQDSVTCDGSVMLNLPLASAVPLYFTPRKSAVTCTQ